MIVANGVQIVPELGALVGIETGRRFIEAQQDRVCAHRARDFEPALGAIGKFPRRIIGAIEYMTSCGVGICGKCSSPSGALTCVDGPFLTEPEFRRVTAGT